MKKISLFLTCTLLIFKFSCLAQVPDWAKGVVWYQIFPERFANGDPSNDPEAEKTFINSDSIPSNWKIREWTSNWFSLDEWEKTPEGNSRSHIFDRRYGGDIKGIIDHLDYLEELGIGAIYINPVFEASSLHKYDGSTFHHIDVNFGPDPVGDRKLIDQEIPDDPSTWKWTSADKLFLELVQEVHKRNMKIIIDGVFNHTGVQFWAFQDIVRNGENSSYKDWYRIKKFDDPETPINEFDYDGWWDVKSLPEFNKTESDLHPGPKQYIFNITKRWLDPNTDGDPSDGIDGWRLDVAIEIPLGFWRSWANMVKSINHNAVIIGELWELSPDFVSEKGPFDALMNYNFAFAVNDYLIADTNSISTQDFVNKLDEITNTYSRDNLFALQNLIDSHDTERLSSMIKNPGRKYNHDSNERNSLYNPGKPTEEEYQKQKIIAAFQMAYLGSPQVYYGDEIGMWGATDPHDRKPMVWDELDYDDEVIDESSGFGTGFGSYEVSQNINLLNWYKKIISIRNNSKALKIGDLKFIYISDSSKTFAFERSYKNEKVICCFNLDENVNDLSIPVDNENISMTDLFGGKVLKMCGIGQKNFQINIPSESVMFYKYTYKE